LKSDSEDMKDLDPKPDNDPGVTNSTDTEEKVNQKPSPQSSNPQPQPELTPISAEEKNGKRIGITEKQQTPAKKVSQPGTPIRKNNGIGKSISLDILECMKVQTGSRYAFKTVSHHLITIIITVLLS